MSDIYDNSTDQIEVDILVDGTSISKTYPVIKVEVEKKINDIPTAKVELIDGDAPSGDEGFKAAKDVAIGKSLEVKAGYKTKTETIFKGVISAKDTEQNKNENPMMVITGQDESAKLMEGKKTAVFSKQSDKDIITKIVQDCGVEKSISISESTKFEQMIQYQMSDWDFVKKRASINGCILVPNDNKLSIAAPSVSESEVSTLKYGDAIKEHSLQVDDSNQPTKVSAICWDPAQQKVIEASSSEPTVNEQGDKTGKKLSENKGTEHLLQTSVFMEQAALKAWANAYLQNIRLAKIGGRINTQGDPKFLPDTIVKLEGFGDGFNGKGYIGRIKHTILPGDWETELELGLPKIPGEEDEKGSEARVNTITGLQIAVVKQIHEDPENAYRVLVTIPSLPEIKDGIWVRLAGPYALKEKGWFFYPEKDDEVIIGFIEGHPAHAVILGSLYSKKNTAPYKPDEDNSTKAIVTKSELKIEFNDKDKIITIATPKEQQIVIDDKDEKVTVTDKKKNVITLSEDGIVIESKAALELKASKDITIKGKNIKIQASSALNLEGKDLKMKAKMALEGEGLDVNLKGKKGVAIEGKATAEFKASGQTTIKGAMLKLN